MRPKTLAESGVGVQLRKVANLIVYHKGRALKKSLDASIVSTGTDSFIWARLEP
jgi:hypothetical protein